jgi:hypothetical protein
MRPGISKAALVHRKVIAPAADLVLGDHASECMPSDPVERVSLGCEHARGEGSPIAMEDPDAGSTTSLVHALFSHAIIVAAAHDRCDTYSRQSWVS